MFSEAFSLLYWCLCFAFDACVMSVRVLRALPPLLVDISAVLAGALYFSRLNPPKDSVKLSPGTCVAHRGAYLDAPENSMEAFKYCVDKCCRFVEFDVRSSRDGECVVWHDSAVAGVDIASHDWADLAGLDTGRGGNVPVRLCRLADVGELAARAGLGLIVDMKDCSASTCAAVVRLFGDHPRLLENSMVTSFNPLAVYKVRRIEPRITGALSYQPYSMSLTHYSALGDIRYRYPSSPVQHWASVALDALWALAWACALPPRWPGCSALLLHRDALSPQALAAWRARGYLVALYPANLPRDKQHAARALGVPYLADTLVGEQ